MERALAVEHVPDGVELLRWPQDAALRRRLARAAVPRLLLVGNGETPPPDLGGDEDWIRVPCDDGDLIARAERLLRSVSQLQHEHLWVDDHRVLHRGTLTVVLSRAEAAVIEVLANDPGTYVSRAELERRVWPDDGAPSRRAIDTVIYRLRRRLVGLNLTIRTSRTRGFALTSG